MNEVSFKERPSRCTLLSILSSLHRDVDPIFISQSVSELTFLETLKRFCNKYVGSLYKKNIYLVNKG